MGTSTTVLDLTGTEGLQCCTGPTLSRAELEVVTVKGRDSKNVFKFPTCGFGS